MSKGKQWWPLQASVDDARVALTDFQQRVRDKQWIRKTERTILWHIYSLDQAGWTVDQMIPVNEYMQFSAHDSAAKNQGRVVVLRMLCMLYKWHSSTRPGAHLAEPPSVFVAPQLDGLGFTYGLVATLAGNPRYAQGKPQTLVISERDLVPMGPDGRAMWTGRQWRVPQAGDSFRWMTTKSWAEQRTTPAFGKWIYGSYTERRGWVEGLAQGTSAQQEAALSQAGLMSWAGAISEPWARQMGAIFVPRMNRWVLPSFWDSDAVLEWRRHIETLLSSQRPSTPPTYRTMVASADKAGNDRPAPDEDGDVATVVHQ